MANDKLVRALLEHRIQNDPLARQRGASVQDVQRLSKMGLLGTPEASIITIVGNFRALKKRGLSDADAITKIAQLRSSDAPREALGSLEAFIHYEVAHEEPGRLPISKPFVDRAIEAALTSIEGGDDRAMNRGVAFAHAATGIGLGVLIVIFASKSWAPWLSALPFLYGLRQLWTAMTASDQQLAELVGDASVDEER